MQGIGAMYPRRWDRAPRHGDRTGIDVDAHELGRDPAPGERTTGRGQEPTVAAGRIEHPADRSPGAPQRHRDDVLDEVVRREPLAEPLALDGTARMPVLDRLWASHGASLGFALVSDVAGRYLNFDRAEWADLRAATPLTLRENELASLRGINDHIDLDEVVAVYLPLTRLLNLYVAATQNLHKVSAAFLGTLAPKVPYVIGVAGSVAVGKSTFARILQALLARWPDHPKVDLVTTDGFLYPNQVLHDRNIMNRKGFPESYDTRRLLEFLRDLKSGQAETRAPVYSHVVYDIVEGEEVVVRQPDIVIVEGLNVLQVGSPASPEANEFVSDYFDFSIYIDAEELAIEDWYVQRFLKLCETVFQNPDSFFQHYAHLTHDEAVATARGIWHEINGKNLRENIAPTRSRASLLLHKGADHRVTAVSLRRL
jgi:type I pantothenate kinase